MNVITTSTFTSILAGIGLVIAYNVALAIYRLFFHPLAKFPGPKLAAASGWYEFYYDIWNQGQFIWHTRDLHDQYGPIVRVTPHELHIRDSEYYDEIYAPSAKKRDKWEGFVVMGGAPGATFSAVSHELHRQRRAVLNPFFSKRVISNNEAQIKEKIEHLCRRFRAYSDSGEVLRIDAAYSALTMDIITHYMFGEPYNQLDDPSWSIDWRERMVGMSANGVVLRQFPWALPVLKAIPLKTMKRLNPDAASLMEWQKEMEKDVDSLLTKNAQGKKAEGTIFQAILDSDLPPQEKEAQRLCDEAQTMVGAGTETTAKVLAFITFFLNSNSSMLQKLREEIETSDSSSNGGLTLVKLEKLPYLTACINEGIRMTSGVTARLPRVAHEPTQYQQWTIPAGTPVSQSNYFVNNDPEIFPDPLQFRPERWIEAAERGTRLERYMVSFGRGSRSCVGINLAWAELYLTLAHVVTRFDITPFETIVERDIMIDRDCFIGVPKVESQGIRVRIRAR